MGPALSSGTLKGNQHGTRRHQLPYQMTCLDECHLPQIMDLQETIVQNLPSKELLQTFSWDFMKQHLGDNGFVLGVFVEERLVAFRNVYFPAHDDTEWNLGIDVGLEDKELPYVANLQMVCVHPEFRGNALALRMNTVALQLLREMNTYYHICATVSPDNIWNIPVLLASGFSISTIKTKYGGKIRFVAYQDLRRPLAFSSAYSIPVRIENLEMQKKLLDMGYHGTHIVRRKQKRRPRGGRIIEIVFQTVDRAHRDIGIPQMPNVLNTPQRIDRAGRRSTL